MRKQPKTKKDSRYVANLENQLPAILQSRLSAQERMVKEGYQQAFQLTEKEPPEFWRHALSRSNLEIQSPLHSAWRTSEVASN